MTRHYCASVILIKTAAALLWSGFKTLKGSDQTEVCKRLIGVNVTVVQFWEPNCLKPGGNVLLLDEPTNDLDVRNLTGPRRTLILEFLVLRMVISKHDRWFLDRIGTHINGHRDRR